MFDYTHFYTLLDETPMRSWLELLEGQVNKALYDSNNGHMPAWQNALKALPLLPVSNLDLRADAVRVGDVTSCDEAVRASLEATLRTLHPWRKGPFDIHGVRIDTEWRSDFKWNRLIEHIQPLKDRHVLDIGCGNGYHVWRMLGEGAKWVLGVDPFLAYVMQYWAVRHFIPDVPAFVLPLGLEQLPFDKLSFDTIFSMGVLYHRRSPFDHLIELRKGLAPGGELVLETLVIDGACGETLVPAGRYAKMRNVWFIPSCLTLEAWLKRSGFTQVDCVSVERTTTEEQRSTSWMEFESLADYLDPKDNEKTIEGYPGPKRAVFICS